MKRSRTHRIGAAALVCLLASASCTSVIRVLAEAPARGPDAHTARIYVIRRGWHIDVGFAAEDLTPPLAHSLEGLPGAHYAVFGFGDRRYLEARQRGPGLHTPDMLAALWPGRALLLVTGLAATPGAAFGDDHVIVLAASAAAVRRAQSFVWASFQPGAQQHGNSPTPVGADDSLPPALPGPYDGSLYFESSRRYSALHTCNTWAAEVLQAAGLPMHTGTILFASQLWTRLQAYRGDVIANQLHGGFVPS